MKKVACVAVMAVCACMFWSMMQAMPRIMTQGIVKATSFPKAKSAAENSKVSIWASPAKKMDRTTPHATSGPADGALLAGSRTTVQASRHREGHTPSARTL